MLMSDNHNENVPLEMYCKDHAYVFLHSVEFVLTGIEVKKVSRSMAKEKGWWKRWERALPQLWLTSKSHSQLTVMSHEN